jgi:hypothetical protein
VKRDAQLREELDGTHGGKRAQHVANDTVRSSPEVALRHDTVGDVAPAAAADQNLGANRARAVETHDPCTRVVAGARNCGHETGGACANDDYVSRFAEAHRSIRLG